ncbi:hypothetical protein JTB14_014559 [Gonioctena quinquepunctata]|nr:hypothetical protein JTB14_014559 [Gonioctena quinquepunctata]
MKEENSVLESEALDMESKLNEQVEVQRQQIEKLEQQITYHIQKQAEQENKIEVTKIPTPTVIQSIEQGTQTRNGRLYKVEDIRCKRKRGKKRQSMKINSFEVEILNDDNIQPSGENARKLAPETPETDSTETSPKSIENKTSQNTILDDVEVVNLTTDETGSNISDDRFDRVTAEHGGTLILDNVNEDIFTFVNVEKFSNLLEEKNFEFSLVYCDAYSLYVLCIYRTRDSKKTPSEEMTIFFEKLEMLLLQLPTNSNIVLTGDLNINFEDKSNRSCQLLEQLLDSFNLTMHVKSATHIYQSASTIIDYICSNVDESNVTCSVLPANLSDHEAVLSTLSFPGKDGEHRRKSIFDREDIVVNQEERLVLADANFLDPVEPHSSRHYHQSKSPRSPVSHRNRSRSNSKKRRSRSNSPRRSISPGSTDRRRSPGKRRSLERGDQSGSRVGVRRSREKSFDKYRDKNYEKERGGSSYRKKSISPLRPGEYRPSHPSLRQRSRSRDGNEKNRYSRRSRSLSRDTYKPSSSTRRSVSPQHKKQPVRRSSHSRSPTRKPSLSPSRRQRRSRSPGPYHSEKGRGRSKERKRSPSPPRQGYRRRSRSPHARRSSRSPPSRQERYRPPPDTRSRYSKSPHPPVVSFSPPRTRTHRPRSRSPDHERDRRYRETRRGQRHSRSRSPRRRSRSRSPRHREMYNGPPPEFGYYEGIPGAEFWYPGPLQPGFPGMPRFYPPAYYPRGIPPRTPIILPPRYPMMFPPVRPRIIYNSRKIKTVIQAVESEPAESEPVASEPVTQAAVVQVSQEIVADNLTVEETEKKDEGPKDDSKKEPLVC